ncbi:TPA: hypothetical protein ACM7BF_005145, partial [Escherichia coli]
WFICSAADVSDESPGDTELSLSTSLYSTQCPAADTQLSLRINDLHLNVMLWLLAYLTASSA